jgi:hypothetical protein
MFEKIISRIVDKILKDRIAQIVRMDPARNYIVVVPDDKTAKDLAEGINSTFQMRGSSIVVVAAREINLIELSTRSSRPEPKDGGGAYYG